MFQPISVNCDKLKTETYLEPYQTSYSFFVKIVKDCKSLVIFVKNATDVLVCVDIREFVKEERRKMFWKILRTCLMENALFSYVTLKEDSL